MKLHALVEIELDYLLTWAPNQAKAWPPPRGLLLHVGGGLKDDADHFLVAPAQDLWS